MHVSLPARSIEEISPGNFLVDDKSYYLKLDDSGVRKNR